MTAPDWWVYLLRCADDTYYVGVSRNLVRRLREHNGDSPGGARYTRGRRPVILHAACPCADRRAAAQLEWRAKRLSRARKATLQQREGWLSGAVALSLAATNRQEAPAPPPGGTEQSPPVSDA